MGLFRRVFGTSRDRIEDRREAVAVEVHAEADVDGESLVEVPVVGESHRQDAFERIAGAKEAFGKETRVGVTLRAEPSNTYDANAIRIEVMGQLVGYVPRAVAEVMSGPLQQRCRGVLEGRGLVVGGWRDGVSEGHYGVRVWITTKDVDRLGVDAADIDSSLRPPAMKWPDLPPIASGEHRLSPTPADLAAQRYGTQVTVTCEEHYQAAIEAGMPVGWEPDRTWPVLVELFVAECNPHAKKPAPCIEVRIGGLAVGYFTPAMTDRHRPRIDSAIASGSLVTAAAQASRGTTAGVEIWQLKVTMAAL